MQNLSKADLTRMISELVNPFISHIKDLTSIIYDYCEIKPAFDNIKMINDLFLGTFLLNEPCHCVYCGEDKDTDCGDIERQVCETRNFLLSNFKVINFQQDRSLFIDKNPLFNHNNFILRLQSFDLVSEEFQIKDIFYTYKKDPNLNELYLIGYNNAFNTINDYSFAIFDNKLYIVLETFLK